MAYKVAHLLASYQIFSIILGVLSTQDNATVLYPCKSEIFCRGDLLRAVQMAKLFNDSKTFVDMRLKQDANATLHAFKALGPNPSRSTIKTFVGDFFEPPGHDLETWEPADWKENPAFIDKLKDSKLKDFGRALNTLWKKLGRNISAEARATMNRSSLIVVDKPFIVPGGRFREYYYWDTYWTVKGLLVSEMPNTVRNMIDNFVQLVREIGFIPNGGRIYYTKRSQPPFLIPIVELYLNYTEDFDYVKGILSDLEAEYNFWKNTRSVSFTIAGKTHSLNRYQAQMNVPRPESYYEDVHTAESLPVADRPEVYQNLASAAESGWDFSSRWFNRSSTELRSTRTCQIIPVDLNAILYRNEKTLASLFKRAGEHNKADRFNKLAEQRSEAMEAVLWNERQGSWLDYDLQYQSGNPNFYPSALAPMWAGLHHDNETRDLVVMNTLKNQGAFRFPGGIPTTTKRGTGQQWDFPNSWPPLQDIAIEAMAQSKNSEVKLSSQQLAQKWIATNYKAWKSTGHMYEKYNAKIQGAPGGGGEYDIQVGFGWTNGVALHLLKMYGAELELKEPPSAGVRLQGHFLASVILAFLCVLSATLL